MTRTARDVSLFTEAEALLMVDALDLAAATTTTTRHGGRAFGSATILLNNQRPREAAGVLADEMRLALVERWKKLPKAGRVK